MSKVRIRSLDRPDRTLLALATVLALALAAVVGLTAPTWAQDAESGEDASSAEGIDGTWAVTTEIGSFDGTEELDPFSSSWVGFRVAEVLRSIGDAEAVGRTPDVSGELIANGSTIEGAAIEVDLTTIKSDQSRRDPAIQRSLDTRSFPTASFASNGPVDLGAVPVEGEPFEANIPGTLTIRGIDKDVELQLTAQRIDPELVRQRFGEDVGDLVVVVGTLPIDFTDFDVTMPVLGPVISVEDTGNLEWQLWLERQG